jgi:CRP-like cAMP-binding protein
MVSSDRPRSSVEILMALYEDDPEFKHATSVLSFRAGQIVAQPRVLAGNIFILMMGRIKLIYDNPNGPRLALATLNPGAVFGGGAQPRKFDSTMSAQALTDCVAWMVPAPQAQELVQRYPALRWGLLETVGERLAQVQERPKRVAYQRLPARLAARLLDLSSGGIIHGPSRQALAGMLGAYRETIGVYLRDFRDAGLLKLGSRGIELRDVVDLRAAADVPVRISEMPIPSDGQATCAAEVVHAAMEDHNALNRQRNEP